MIKAITPLLAGSLFLAAVAGERLKAVPVAGQLKPAGATLAGAVARAVLVILGTPAAEM